MDTAVVEKFAVWARRALKEGVGLRARKYRLLGADAPAPDAVIEVDGRAITDIERAQRAQLLARIAREGEDAFIEELAYTWFNRLLAIRYLEANDSLPSRTRILSNGTGAFDSQAMNEVSTLDLPGLDTRAALELKLAGKDEDLFRMLLLAQCAQLAECMPAVFEQVDAADALMLPDNLLAPDGVVARLVGDMPDDEWHTVEIIGWAYQFYISEKKDEVFAGFKRKRKAETVAEIGPATQLFTPEWIVRYLVENSLGRLWMLNNPTSSLRERMRYYIEPEGACEDFIRIAGPEGIRLLDPACGSGHILVYAFDLLVAMYEERGYRAADAARLILEKNLVGFEIDGRAAQLAAMALTFKALGLDRRFLRRGEVARPQVLLLASVVFEPEELELMPQVAAHDRELDTLAHLSEVGSLWQPDASFADALRAAEVTLAAGDGSLLAASACKKVTLALAACEALDERFAVVAANPPYMGSSSFGSWLSAWMKRHYPDSKSDLCTAFIERNASLLQPRGYASQITMQSWMFLGSFEKLRVKLLAGESLVSMAHIGARGFDSIGGDVVSTTAFVLYGGKSVAARGAYVRLVDEVGEAAKESKYLEAIRNPDCGWFYRADADSFNSIPGTPIAYWVPSSLKKMFLLDEIEGCFEVGSGLSTGDNERFLRRIWEVDASKISYSGCDCNSKWFLFYKGGEYRKWYGNLEYVVNWENNGEEIKYWVTHNPKDPKTTSWSRRIFNTHLYFLPCITWSVISSSVISFRLGVANAMISNAAGGIFSPCGADISAEKMTLLFAALNTSIWAEIFNILNPTLNYSSGIIAKAPMPNMQIDASLERRVKRLVDALVDASKSDWDSFETSWDFKHHPLV